MQVKRVITVAFFVAVLCGAAFFGARAKTHSNISTLSAVTITIEDALIDRPNSITYIGNNRLIIADQQGVKQLDVSEENGNGKVTPLFPTDTEGYSFGSTFNFAYTTNIVFHKETDTLFIQDGGNPNIVYAYNESPTPQGRTLDKAEVDTILGRDISLKDQNEDITDIVGQPLPSDFVFDGTQHPLDITVDKYNRTVYYINDTIAWNPKLMKKTVPGWWSFEENPAVNNNWSDGSKPLQAQDGGDLFYTANSSTVLYQYPSAETPRITLIPAGRNLILLNKDPKFGKAPTADAPNPAPRSFGDTADGALDGWRLVLYEIGNTKYEVGYVQANKLTPVTNYQIDDLANDPRAKSVVKFKLKPEKQKDYYGRVIRYEVPIYKYPTCIINTLTVGSAKKTEQDTTTELPLYYLIEITDTLNWHYFQVKVYDDNGSEKGIGFVATNGIIDIAAEPEYPRVVPNAEIVAEDGEVVKIYKDADGTEEMTEITLKKGAQIRIDLNKKSEDRYQRTAAYNKIYYNDPEIGEWWLIEGYVATKYIKPKESSLSPAQWIGLAMLGAVLIGVLAAFIIVAVSNAKYEKNKRKMNETAPEEPVTVI